jgi:hypothetical protein
MRALAISARRMSSAGAPGRTRDAGGKTRAAGGGATGEGPEAVGGPRRAAAGARGTVGRFREGMTPSMANRPPRIKPRVVRWRRLEGGSGQSSLR